MVKAQREPPPTRLLIGVSSFGAPVPIVPHTLRSTWLPYASDVSEWKLPLRYTCDDYLFPNFFVVYSKRYQPKIQPQLGAL